MRTLRSFLMVSQINREELLLFLVLLSSCLIIFPWSSIFESWIVLLRSLWKFKRLLQFCCSLWSQWVNIMQLILINLDHWSKLADWVLELGSSCMLCIECAVSINLFWWASWEELLINCWSLESIKRLIEAVLIRLARTLKSTFICWWMSHLDISSLLSVTISSPWSWLWLRSLNLINKLTFQTILWDIFSWWI